jgi:gliding motility-associated-like protein
LYWGEVRVGRCNDRDSVVVRYKPLPQASIGNDTLLCEGEPFQLRVQGNGDSFVWSDGAEGRERPLGAPGMYWVDAFLDGCVARAGALIETQDRPLISLGPDTVICHDQTLRLDPGWGGADRYSWQDGSVGRSFQARESGLYWVEIVDGACTVRDSVLVTKVRCNYFQSYVPNAFSPNGDGVNDTWEVFFPTAVQILDFRASVFDRWGNLVFQSADPDVAWDGMFRSRPLPSGVYIYQIEVEYVDDRRRDREVIGGDVLLLR